METQIKFIFWNVHKNINNILNLLDYGWNNNIDVSDHLPLYFEIRNVGGAENEQ